MWAWQLFLAHFVGPGPFLASGQLSLVVRAKLDQIIPHWGDDFAALGDDHPQKQIIPPYVTVCTMRNPFKGQNHTKDLRI